MSAKKRVQRLRPPKESPRPPLRLPPADPDREHDEAPGETLAQKTAAKVGGLRRIEPASVAWAKIADPLRKGDGQRVLFFGNTGKGKTTGLKDFLRYLEAEKLIDVFIIHDVKYSDHQQYEGEAIHEARDLYDKPPESYPATRVLRRKHLDHIPSYDRAARAAVEMGNAKIRTALVGDEFSRALEERLPQRRDPDSGKLYQVTFREGETMRLVCEGRGLHASHFAAKQLPQFTPSEILDQSEIVMFGLASKAVRHLEGGNTIDSAAAEVIPRLEVGQFVWQPSEGDFDGTIYQVPAP